MGEKMSYEENQKDAIKTLEAEKNRRGERREALQEGVDKNYGKK